MTKEDLNEGMKRWLIVFVAVMAFIAYMAKTAKADTAQEMCQKSYISFQKANNHCLSATVVNMELGKKLQNTPCGSAIDNKEQKMNVDCGYLEGFAENEYAAKK